jgi:phospholipid-binding lipoprotein MlaA
VQIPASSRGAVFFVAIILWLAASLMGCATPPTDPTERALFEQNNDPMEPLNRNILDVNQFVDRIVIEPAAKVYVAVLPEIGRDAIHHVLDNMKEPTLFFNNVLQGEFERAGITLGRFAANTTLGLGGLLDVATDWGLKRQPADFGQTLFAWGLPDGPYLILPLLGPSNPRDAIGMGIDSYSDPFTILATTHGLEELTNARLVAGGIDQRAGAIDTLDELQRNSLDFYAQLRSLSQQHRAAELKRGAAPDPGTDFYQDPSAPPAGSAKPAAPSASAPPTPAPAAGNNPRKERAAAHPIRKAAVRCSIIRTSPSAPARCSTATNSERRVASSLIVPLR